MVYWMDNNGEKHPLRFIKVFNRTYRFWCEPNGNVILKEDGNQN